MRDSSSSDAAISEALEALRCGSAAGSAMRDSSSSDAAISEALEALRCGSAAESAMRDSSSYQTAAFAAVFYKFTVLSNPVMF